MHLLETESVGDLVGLLEILEDMETSVDIATLDDSLDEERTTLINLLNDAEALTLVNVDQGDVSLTDKGREFLKSNVTRRKMILKELLRNLEPFHSIIKKFRSLKINDMDKEEFEEFLADNFPSEDISSTLRLILNWGRYAKLIDYDPDHERLVYVV